MSSAQPFPVPPLSCRFCGKTLPAPPALICPDCKAFQEQCSNCGVAMPAGAKRCNDCKAFQTGNPCRSCGAQVPRGARCGVCNAAQDIRRFFPDTQLAIALVMALISMLAAVVPPVVRWWNYGSNTHVRVLGTEAVTQEENGVAVTTNAIRVVVANAGTGHAAVVRSATISFDEDLGVTPAELVILNPEDTLIPPEKSAIVKLALDGSLRGDRSKASELRRRHVTVTLRVEETRPLHEPRIETRPDSVPGEQIHAFLTEHAPV